MVDDPLTLAEKHLLLQLARDSVERAARGQPAPEVDLAALPERLRAAGVCFVTLTIRHGELRGCIGALEAHLPLAEDVCQHAAAAAVEDYRFPPVTPLEVPQLHIEISRLTAPVALPYQQPADLLTLLHPYVDGVVLYYGAKRATFLPQVWQKLPDPAQFLTQLCLKMGVSANVWRQQVLRVEVYQVEEFEEED